METKMLHKTKQIIFFTLFFTAFLPFEGYSHEIDTEVIIAVKDDKILAFSAAKDRWSHKNLRSKEKVVSKKAHGNIGIVVTTKQILGFSVITDHWTTKDLKIDEELEEIMVEGNVATVITDQRVIAFSAHNGQWQEAP
jgi:hypothetical protein